MHAFLLIALAVALTLLACVEAGWRFRLHHKERSNSGLGVIEGAVFGLLGLLLAFAFSGADSRFEVRRQLIVQEANAIGTAYLRVDLLPPATQPQIRADFRDYVDSRLAFYVDLKDNQAKAAADSVRSSALQQKIWKESVAAVQQTSSNAVMSLVISSLNNMIDVTATRSTAQQTHPPVAIYFPLMVLALAGSLIAGYGVGEQKTRPWLHTLVYVVALTITLYTVLDMEFPRYGIIRVDRYDQALVNQRNSMK